MESSGDDFTAIASTFHLYNDNKRLTITSKDLSRKRVELIFQLEEESIYLEDDITRETFFPTPHGSFQTLLMRDRGSFRVWGREKFQQAVLNPAPYTGPRSHFTPPASTSTFIPPACRPPAQQSSTFQNPGRKNKSFRRKIYLADVEDDGDISAYTSVHVTINEGTGVQAIATTVQEYINSSDAFTMCDSKGVPISDSAETKDLEFWKTPSRKIYAIKNTDISKLTRNSSKKRRLEADTPETVKTTLANIEETLKVELKGVESTISGMIEEKMTELAAVVNQAKVTQVAILQNMQDAVQNLGAEATVTKCLKEAFICKICTNLPSTVVVVAACCGQIVGCGACVQTYLENNDDCLLCKSTMFGNKLVFLRGVSEILLKLSVA
ncbi:uncharacterized protein LOC143118556 [Alosa pseudoharengus]|uniref:uncharacterized protein LOC143118556 n=1 Tax=Alosa pseudoharengus TaxID=34774 RepID=UPI003F88DB88